MKITNVLTTISTIDNLLVGEGLVPAAINNIEDEALEGLYHFPTVNERGATVDEYIVKLTFVTEDTINYRLYKERELVLSSTDEQSFIKGVEEVLPILLNHLRGLKELTYAIAKRIDLDTDETFEITIDGDSAAALMENRYVMVVIRRHANTGYQIEVSDRKEGVSKFMTRLPTTCEIRHLIELAKKS